MYTVVQGGNPRMGHVLYQDFHRRAQKPQTPAMMRRLLKDFQPITEGGIYLPPGIFEFSVDVYRVERVAIKIAEGLYYREHRCYMPASHCRDIGMCVELAELPKIYAILWNVAEAKAVCPEVFSYKYFNYGGWSLCIMLFWQSFVWRAAFQESP